jgi:outer membrane immunogenic protein
VLVSSAVAAAIALAASAIGPVRAADLPLKAQPAPVYSWTGFYIGGDLGVRSTQTDLTTDAFAFVGPPLPLIPKPQRPSG